MSEEIVSCVSCGKLLTGNYCQNCGEKKRSEKDLKLSTLISEAFAQFTNIDGKAYRTFGSLLFRPGKLTMEFIAGRRIIYLKPLQVFLISNLFIFLFLSDTDIFRTPSKWYFQESFDGVNVLSRVNEIMARDQVELNEVALRYDKSSSELSKAVLILMIPLFALGVRFIAGRKKQFGEHLVFSIHFLSFIWICSVLSYLALLGVVKMLSWMNVDTDARLMYFSLMFITVSAYLYLALRRFFTGGIPKTIIKSIFLIFWFLVVLQVYRVSINLITLYTL